MDPENGTRPGAESSVFSKWVEAELDHRIFHLKTLYDVSKDLPGTVDVEEILKNFLLMTTGNFGVVEGFLVFQELRSKEISHFVCGLRKRYPKRGGRHHAGEGI